MIRERQHGRTLNSNTRNGTWPILLYIFALHQWILITHINDNRYNFSVPEFKEIAICSPLVLTVESISRGNELDCYILIFNVDDRVEISMPDLLKRGEKVIEHSAYLNCAGMGDIGSFDSHNGFRMKTIHYGFNEFVINVVKILLFNRSQKLGRV